MTTPATDSIAITALRSRPDGSAIAQRADGSAVELTVEDLVVCRQKGLRPGEGLELFVDMVYREKHGDLNAAFNAATAQAQMKMNLRR